jgi:hypothetical protein
VLARSETTLACSETTLFALKKKKFGGGKEEISSNQSHFLVCLLLPPCLFDHYLKKGGRCFLQSHSLFPLFIIVFYRLFFQEHEILDNPEFLLTYSSHRN